MLVCPIAFASPTFDALRSESIRELPLLLVAKSCDCASAGCEAGCLEESMMLVSAALDVGFGS